MTRGYPHDYGNPRMNQPLGGSPDIPLRCYRGAGDALATLELFLHVRMNGTNEEAVSELNGPVGYPLVN